MFMNKHDPGAWRSYLTIISRIGILNVQPQYIPAEGWIEFLIQPV